MTIPPSPNPLPTTEGVTQGWQDIASAPKGDDPILGYVRGKFYNDAWPDVVRWDDIFNCWKSGPREVTVSHWLPIPPMTEQ